MIKYEKIKYYLLVAVLILASLYLTVYFGTSFFSVGVNSNPIKLYYGGPNEEKVPVTVNIGGEKQESHGSHQKYSLLSIEITNQNPFEESISKMKFYVQNYSNKENFWIDVGDGESIHDKQKFWDYQKENLPDFILSWNFISNDYLPIWIEPFISVPDITVTTDNFLKKINYYTYSNEFYIDTKYEGYNFFEHYYLPSDFGEIKVNLIIDKHYKINSPNEYSLQKHDDQTNLVSFLIRPNKITSIEIIDLEAKKDAEVFSLIFGIISASLIGHTVIDLIKLKINGKKKDVAIVNSS